jgi:hypothetical protein
MIAKRPVGVGVGVGLGALAALALTERAPDAPPAVAESPAPA